MIMRQSDYDLIAPRYEEWMLERQRLQWQAIEACMVSPIHQPLLDVGAGTCLVAKWLMRDVISLDWSRNMLNLGTGPRVRGDFQRLPFADHSFGTVFSMSALETEEGLNKKLSELFRVLRSGGRFYITVLKTEDLASLEKVINTFDLSAWRRVDANDAVLFYGQR